MDYPRRFRTFRYIMASAKQWFGRHACEGSDSLHAATSSTCKFCPSARMQIPRSPNEARHVKRHAKCTVLADAWLLAGEGQGRQGETWEAEGLARGQCLRLPRGCLRGTGRGYWGKRVWKTSPKPGFKRVRVAVGIGKGVSTKWESPPADCFPLCVSPASPNVGSAAPGLPWA